jgi:hypothetical protein
MHQSEHGENANEKRKQFFLSSLFVKENPGNEQESQQEQNVRNTLGSEVLLT